MDVTPIIFEKNLRNVCGTWTIDEYIAYLKTTNLSQKECKQAIRDFKEGEEMLRDMCKKECYGCSYDLLKCMSVSSCKAVVEHRNMVAGGKKKSKKNKNKDDAQSTIEKESGVFVNSKQKKTNKNDPKDFHGIVKKISHIQDCPEYDSKDKCVRDFHYQTGKKEKCIPDNEVIGFGKYELSDQHCYQKKKLEKWVNDGNNYSPALGENHTFTDDDLKIIKGKMLEQEQNVILSMVNNILGRFLSGIEEWKANVNNKDRMASSNLKQQAAKSLAGATGGMMAAYFGFSFATGGLGLAIGAVAGAAASMGWLQNKVTNAGIDLGIWIVKDPKTAMMFMMVVKMSLRSMCKEMAKMTQMANYERRSTSGYYANAAKGVLGTIKEAGEISIGGIVRGCLRGETWKKIWSNGGDFAATCVASVIPGGHVVKGAATAIVSGIVGAAEEATRSGIEIAAYHQDIKKGTELVMDILAIILDPVKCMKQHGLVKYTGCGQLHLDERACRGAPECKFIPGEGITSQRCDEKECDERETKDTCERGGKCIYEANKCRPAGYTEGWFS